MLPTRDLTPYLEQSEKFINTNPASPQWPYRLSVMGESGSGKTNMIIDLLFSKNMVWDHLYVYAKDLEEPLYKFVKKLCTNIKDKMEKDLLKRDGIPTSLPDIVTFGDSIDDIIDVDELEKAKLEKKQTIILFDDFVTEKDQKKIEDLFIRGRKKRCSMIYLSQNYTKTPSLVRGQSNYFAIYKPNDRKQIRNISDSLSGGVGYETFKKLFNECTMEQHSFMVIDTNASSLPMKFRKGWDHLYMTGNEE